MKTIYPAIYPDLDGPRPEPCVRYVEFYNVEGALVHSESMPRTCRRSSMQASMDRRRMDKVFAQKPSIVRAFLVSTYPTAKNGRMALAFQNRTGRSMFEGYLFDYEGNGSLSGMTKD